MRFNLYTQALLGFCVVIGAWSKRVPQQEALLPNAYWGTSQSGKTSRQRGSREGLVQLNFVQEPKRLAVMLQKFHSYASKLYLSGFLCFSYSYFSGTGSTFAWKCLLLYFF